MLDDFAHLSQTTHVNVMNCVKLSSDLCESNAVHLKEEKCDVDISDNTGESSVDISQDRGQWRAYVRSVMNLRVP